MLIRSQTLMRFFVVVVVVFSHTEDPKHFPVNGISSGFQESRYTSDYFVSEYLSATLHLQFPSTAKPVTRDVH